MLETLTLDQHQSSPIDNNAGGSNIQNYGIAYSEVQFY
jgi:hypothetical protein